LSGEDPSTPAARDVSRLLAAAPGLRQIVELADREDPDQVAVADTVVDQD
jgi:hypothetical protein